MILNDKDFDEIFNHMHDMRHEAREPVKIRVSPYFLCCMRAGKKCNGSPLYECRTERTLFGIKLEVDASVLFIEVDYKMVEL